MSALSNETLAINGGTRNEATPRAMFRIAIPSFRFGNGKSQTRIQKFHPTTREELQSLFNDDLRRPLTATPR